MNCNCSTRTNVNTKAKLKADEFIRTHLERFLMSQADRNNDILRDLRSHHIKDYTVKDEDVKINWVEQAMDHGMQLCWQTCMPFLYAVSRSQMYELRRLCGEGVLLWQHRGKGKTNNAGILSLQIIGWLQTLKDNVGEALPTDDTKFELPPGSICSYWSDYTMDMAEQGRRGAQYDWFRKVWLERFPELMIPAHARWVSIDKSFWRYVEYLGQEVYQVL